MFFLPSLHLNCHPAEETSTCVLPRVDSGHVVCDVTLHGRLSDDLKTLCPSSAPDYDPGLDPSHLCYYQVTHLKLTGQRSAHYLPVTSHL